MLAWSAQLPTALWRRLFGGLTEAQRKDVAISICQLGAVALLAFGLVNGVVTGVQVVLAWAHVTGRSGLTPLAAGGGQWRAFLDAHATLRLALDVPTLPLRVLAAALLTPRYRTLTQTLQRRLPGREQEPLLNRLLALAVAWLGLNVVAVGSATVASAWAAGRFALLGR